MKSLITPQISRFTWMRIITVIATLCALQVAHTFWDLAWDRVSIADGDYWRLITGHLVHNNSNHLLLNSVGITIALLLIRDTFGVRSFCTLNLLVALLTGIFLYVFEPQLYYYVGFSAVLHGLVASYGINKVPSAPWFGGAILCLLALKLLLEGQPQFTANLIGIRVATEAHFWGLISGLISGVVFICGAHWQKKRLPSHRESAG
jgi:rhomboid family GlyGly-CTERM serine protease